MLTLDDVNNMDRDAFIGAVGWVFEDSPWIAERAWVKRPFATLDALHEAMVGEALSAGPNQQLHLLQAHPELGTSAAVSSASEAEQDAAGLRRLRQSDRERLQTLTATYRAKFGFPFLYAVRGATPQEILNALEARLASTRHAESAEALRQAARIARFRLEDLIS